MEDLLCGPASSSLPEDLIEASRLISEATRRQAACLDMVESILVFKSQDERNREVSHTKWMTTCTNHF